MSSIVPKRSDPSLPPGNLVTAENAARMRKGSRAGEAAGGEGGMAAIAYLARILF